MGINFIKMLCWGLVLTFWFNQESASPNAEGPSPLPTLAYFLNALATDTPKPSPATTGPMGKWQWAPDPKTHMAGCWRIPAPSIAAGGFQEAQKPLPASLVSLRRTGHVDMLSFSCSPQGIWRVPEQQHLYTESGIGAHVNTTVNNET